MRQAQATDAGDRILITQGEFAVSGQPDAVISTLLGSCVASCIWDEEAKVGGMNHLLIGGERLGVHGEIDILGAADMEFLINGLLKSGARRERLRAKVFGGAQMLDRASGIGEANVKFVFDFLAREKVPCLNASVGGTSARALKFWPATGRASMRLVNDPVPEVTQLPTPASEQGNDLELF